MKLTIFGKEVLTIEKAAAPQPQPLTTTNNSPTYNKCTFGQPMPVVIRQPHPGGERLDRDNLKVIAEAVAERTGFEKEFIERVLRALEEID